MTTGRLSSITVALSQSLWFSLLWRAVVLLFLLLAGGAIFLDIDLSSEERKIAKISMRLQSEQLLSLDLSANMEGKLRAPAIVEEIYSESPHLTFYAVLDEHRRVVQSAGLPEGIAERLPPTLAESELISLPQVRQGTEQHSYLLLSRVLPDGKGYLIVGRRVPEGHAVLLALRALSVDDHDWIVLVVFASTLLAAVWAMSANSKSLRELRSQANDISAQIPLLRLRTDHVPTEMRSTVQSINRAFDRLTRAYLAQRSFSLKVAHELRGPLTTLALRLGDLDNGSLAEGLREDTGRMKRLVEQLMGVVRLDAGSLPFGKTTVDLRELTQDCVAEMAPHALERGVSIGMSSPSAPVCVQGESVLLNLAIRNLIENAISHSPPQTEIEITLTADGRLTVRDHGPGVRPEDRQKVFERFWRSATAQPGGAGLGLAIVAEVAAEHGGTAQVLEAPGRGALFVLHVPISAPR